MKTKGRELWNLRDWEPKVRRITDDCPSVQECVYEITIHDLDYNGRPEITQAQYVRSTPYYS